MAHDFKKLERVFKAVANRRRLAILTFLKKVGEARVGDIASAIKLSLKATSKHLGILSAIGAVDWEQRSAEVWYRLASAPHLFLAHAVRNL